MNTQIQQLLDLPGKLNEKIKTGTVNSAVDHFDSNAGIRHYTSVIYTWVALIGLVVMEYSILKAAYEYFTNGNANGMAMAGSILTTLVLIASAFPIAKLIRARGESLGSGHHGMAGFIFGDFIKTNIRLIGEIAAIMALFAALNQTLAFLLDQTLFAASPVLILDVMSKVGEIPMALLAGILNWFDMGGVSDMLSNLTSFKLDASNDYGQIGVDGDFNWNTADLFKTIASYINIIIGLAFLYISLAIYGYLYNLVCTFIKWLSSPAIPISVKNK